MNSKQQNKYAYLTTVVGVALMAITTIYGYVRSLLYRPEFRQAFNSNGQFGNAYYPMHTGARFGFTNNLAILAVVIALVGVVWLGLTMRRTRIAKTD